MTIYKLNKVLETVDLVMERRDMMLSEADRAILQHIFDTTEKYRKSLE